MHIRNHRFGVCDRNFGIRNHRLGVRDRHFGICNPDIRIDRQLGLKGDSVRRFQI